MQPNRESILLTNMKNFLIFFLTSYLMCNLLIAGETLNVKETSLKDRTLYELQLHTNNETRTIWKREVKLIDGEKPADVCALWQWTKNDKGMIAMVVYHNDFAGRFLFFDSDEKLIAELRFGPYWFTEMGKGAKNKFEPPDKLILENEGKIIKEITLRAGKFYDESGKEWGKVELIPINPGLSPKK